VPLIIMQQVQPAAIIFEQHSQQDSIIAQQFLSPLLQVMQTPISVGSKLHMPMVILQQQTIMPFIIMQKLHIPPGIIEQRFCSMTAETLSSQTQTTFMPPLHFSNDILQRGIIIMPPAAGAAGAAPAIPIPMPCIPIKFRSAISVLIVVNP
jgi:hypothetical protein